MPTRREVTTLMFLCCISFALHVVWEYAHLPLYTGYGSLGGPLPVVFYATLGDVAYTLGAALLVSLFKGQWEWIPKASHTDYAGLAILGFCIALFVEYKAWALHRWSYTAAMPLLFGVGLTPLLQMTLLLPLSVYLTTLALKKWRYTRPTR